MAARTQPSPITNNNQDLLHRAFEAVKKYQLHLDSPVKIARFAAWFVAQEMAWQDVAEPPARDVPVLLWDTAHNVVRVGWIQMKGWHIEGDAGEHFTPHKWQRIRFGG